MKGEDPKAEESVRRAASAFLSAAFRALESDHVLPTSPFHPYLEVGRDYFGDEVSYLDEYAKLEEVLTEAFPDRFQDPEARPDPEFPSAYIFSLLEACIARCTRAERPYFAPSPPVDATITQFLEVLASEDYELVCCREVTHLTTSNRQPLQLDNMLIVPSEAAPEGFGMYAERLVPGTFGAFNRQDPRFYDPPQSLLVTRTRTDEENPYAVAARLSATIDRFLTLTRLLHSATASSLWQVWGQNTSVGRLNPQYRSYREALLGFSMIRRTALLTEDDQTPLTKLGEMLDESEVKREGMATTSFDLAMGRFSRSHRVNDAWDNIIDLATAIEATLTGGEDDTEAVGLRIKSRAAALLATEHDPAKAIFEDIGILYRLRSSLVHGGSLKEAKLRTDIRRLSTVREDAPFGVAVALAVDRMRDLARRAFLARLCLAAQPGAIWPLAGGVNVDVALSDDTERIRWRETWRGRLQDAECGSAAEDTRPASDWLSRDDR